MEQFLTSKRNGELGNSTLMQCYRSTQSELTHAKAPIVVVFTKYDALLDRVERTLDNSALKGLSKDAIQELTKKTAKDKLQNVCIAPLEKFAGSDIPHVTVSSGCHCCDCHLHS
jgi:hypothetical protein